jgi:hypothetical protein
MFLNNKPSGKPLEESIMTNKPTRIKFSALAQICEWIPPFLVAKIARKHGVDTKARTFSPWSHVVALLYAQLVHAISLNDICDGLRLHAAKLWRLRGAAPPSRNGLSHASKVRSAAMAEELFWSVLNHLTSLRPRFGGRTYGGMPRRFKRLVHVVDATTIQLVANCIDWARHRRKKAAAKMHLRLNLGSFLPAFAVVDTAKLTDAKAAPAVCAGIGRGEIVVFDKAYVDFAHLFALAARGVFWVTRAKENMQSRCVKRRLRRPQGNILRDDIVVLTVASSRAAYPEPLRRIVALVEIDGEMTEMTFITNNMEWSAASVAELYKCRWGIEAFFKQIKQTLQLCAFLGHSRNAIQWQVWMALLLYVLLRFQAFLCDWSHSFTRLFCLVRSLVWDDVALGPLLRSYGTAGGSFRILAAPHQGYFPGFEAYFAPAGG